MKEEAASDSYEGLIQPPLPPAARPTELKKGAGHVPLPHFDPLPDKLELPILLKMGENVSTDAIMPSGSASMSIWNSVAAMASMSFRGVDEGYAERARKTGDHAIVAGRNYGQGSSREHAALGPRQLGLRAVIAASIARIHGENLVNYGILPLQLRNDDDLSSLGSDAVVTLEGLRDAIARGSDTIRGRSGDKDVEFGIQISPRQREVLLAGGAIAWMHDKLQKE